MAKETGLGAAFYLDGVDLSGDVNSLSRINKGLSPIVQTGIDKYAVERAAGKLDGGFGWVSYFNPENAHPELEGMPRGDRIGSYVHKGTTLGTPVASCVAKQVAYDPTRADSGELTLTVDLQANAWWLDWGYSLTPGKRTDTAGTNGSSVDFGVPDGTNAFDFGLQAYLHVFSFTGTDATVKLQQSSDNGGADAWADVVGGAFTSVTSGPIAERIETARDLTVERYLRVVTTGTFTSMTFAVSVAVNGSEHII